MIQKISLAIGDTSSFLSVVEVGPGMGALTDFEVKKNHPNYTAFEIDERWASHLVKTYSKEKLQVVHQDFLKADLSKYVSNPSIVIGNFPYNISSQILFKVLDYKESITQVVGMFQKEVGVRVAASEGNKDYGVISILIQADYDVEYLFDVPPGCFSPPPKVMSGIIKLTKKNEKPLYNEELFRRIVKTVFQQRRKTLRNGIKPILSNFRVPENYLTKELFNKRPEQLSVKNFISLTNEIDNYKS